MIIIIIIIIAIIVCVYYSDIVHAHIRPVHTASIEKSNNNIFKQYSYITKCCNCAFRAQ